ncbi:DpnI domain-containing protein [Roseivivax sp. THAF30]|uniref:DpnI domain-containing protein n=1 Tax=Roseivivax sp. THAF30 TaxID=2587852 RepID=UPI001267CED2|nr:DpnI domain-containing protein [Roseivivax sp. THAF30]
MATARQQLGTWGEKLVAKACACPSCKKSGTLKQLPTNFKCADLICDFCGYLARVKSANAADETSLPKSILGAAWGPQSERMKAGIYFPLFVVLRRKGTQDWAIYFLSADLQIPEMFAPRKPLSPNARRAGWQGYLIDCHVIRDRFVVLHRSSLSGA